MKKPIEKAIQKEMEIAMAKGLQSKGDITGNARQ